MMECLIWSFYQKFVEEGDMEMIDVYSEYSKEVLC